MSKKVNNFSSQINQIKSSIPRGRALIFEHIVNFKYKNKIYAEGVIFVIFLNGECYFQPVNENSLCNNISNNPNAKIISSNELNNNRKRGISFFNILNEIFILIHFIFKYFHMKGANELLGASKITVYDIKLEKNDLIYLTSFPFQIYNDGVENIIRAPRKILLSPNKKLILMFGILFKGQNCVVM